MNARIDQNAAKILYLGAGTTFFTGGDGLALFNSAHPNNSSTNSATQSNTTTNVLSYDNLKTAAQAMDRYTDDKGIQLLPCRKLRLVVAREKKERAEEILRSIGNPDNANRVSNVFNNGDGYIDYVVANWIPSTTYNNYWFLIDMERTAQMAYMVWGWRPKFDSDNVINNGTKLYTASTMFAPGFQAWQWAKLSPTLAGMLLKKLREFGKRLIEIIPREGLNTLVETMYATARTAEDIVRTAWRHAEAGRNVLSLARV